MSLFYMQTGARPDSLFLFPALTHPFVGFWLFHPESNMFSGKNLMEIPIITEESDSTLPPPPHPHAQLRAFQAPAI